MSSSEEEQLAQIRDWWQRNGKPLLAGGALALVLVFGWQAWKKHELEQSQAASALYQQLLTEMLNSAQPDLAKVAELGGQLKKDFAGQAYAQYASLFLAKAALDQGRLEEAERELREVVAKPADETLGILGRQRLAQVLSARGEPQQALDALGGEAPASFQAAQEELRGDLLLQLGRREEAHAAYRKAMESAAPDAALGALQMKVDNLAQGEA